MKKKHGMDVRKSFRIIWQIMKCLGFSNLMLIVACFLSIINRNENDKIPGEMFFTSCLFFLFGWFPIFKFISMQYYEYMYNSTLKCNKVLECVLYLSCLRIWLSICELFSSSSSSSSSVFFFYQFKFIFIELNYIEDYIIIEQ